MSNTTTGERDRVAELLIELTEGTDHEACLRHLGVAALNLATEADAETLMAAGDALPWAGVYLKWRRRDVSVEQLTRMIEDHALVDHLDKEALRRRLARVEKGEESTVRRSPAEADDGPTDPRVDALRKLVRDDRRISRLADRSAPERRDVLLADSSLLATALQLRADGPRSEAGSLVASALPDWELEAPGRAIELLGRFEATNFDEVPAELATLGDRSRRFEQSLASHLQRHDLLPAVRAALAFGPAADEPLPAERTIRSELTRFSALAEDPTLLELTVALVELRHRPVDHLRGALPLAALTPWVEYLRGPCSKFARVRDISRREATNFAHYALHLVDLFDLAAAPDIEVDEPIRRATMDIEDELKEFALAGQSEDDEPVERPIDLHRYDRSRFRKDGRRAHLADRLSRLCGAWRNGHRSGPPGDGARPDSELLEESRDLVWADEESPEFDAINNLMYRARLRGVSRLESWSPRQMLSVLTVALHRARQTPTIDVDAPFVVDFGPLADWLEDGDIDRRTRLLETLIEVQTTVESSSGVGLETSGRDQSLTLEFSPTDELEALLTLLASTDEEDDKAFAESLRMRLRDVVTAPTDETDTDPDTVRARRPVPSSSSGAETAGRRPPPGPGVDNR